MKMMWFSDKPVERFPVKAISIHLLCHVETANVTSWRQDTGMALHTAVPSNLDYIQE